MRGGPGVASLQVGEGRPRQDLVGGVPNGALTTAGPLVLREDAAETGGPPGWVAG